jgi:hypothetical protein
VKVEIPPLFELEEAWKGEFSVISLLLLLVLLLLFYIVCVPLGVGT